MEAPVVSDGKFRDDDKSGANNNFRNIDDFFIFTDSRILCQDLRTSKSSAESLSSPKLGTKTDR